MAHQGSDGLWPAVGYEARANFWATAMAVNARLILGAKPRTFAASAVSPSSVAGDAQGNAHRASKAQAVDSVANCVPPWLHPPVPWSCRRMSSSASRHRANNICRSGALTEPFMIPNRPGL